MDCVLKELRHGGKKLIFKYPMEEDDKCHHHTRNTTS